MKTKAFNFEVKQVEDDGTFTGYASIFGNVDAQGEKVMPGAFGQSLTKHKREGTTPLLLWQHNAGEPLGGWEDLAEDGKGLWGKGRIQIDAGPTEHRIYTHMKNGNIRGLSIGYREVVVEPNNGVRLLKELDLMEVSIVSFPANRRARIESVKSESWCKLEDLARRFRDGEPAAAKEFEEVLRDAGFPRSATVQIASVGYVKAIRSESEGEKAKAIEDVLTAVRSIKVPSLKRYPPCQTTRKTLSLCSGSSPLRSNPRRTI